MVEWKRRDILLGLVGIGLPIKWATGRPRTTQRADVVFELTQTETVFYTALRPLVQKHGHVSLSTIRFGFAPGEGHEIAVFHAFRVGRETVVDGMYFCSRYAEVMIPIRRQADYDGEKLNRLLGHKVFPPRARAT